MSNEELSDILNEALSELLSEEGDQAVVSLFREPYDGERHRRAVSFHRWISAAFESDSEDGVREAAWNALRELVDTSAQVLKELLLGQTHFLGTSPLWKDGLPLYASSSPRTGKPRLGVKGGNVVTATTRPARDIKKAVERLKALDTVQPLEDDEPLQVVCSHALLHKIVKVLRNEEREFHVIPFRYLSESDPVFVGRITPMAVLKVEKPLLPIANDQRRVIVGAHFSVWLDAPSTSVRIGGYD